MSIESDVNALVTDSGRSTGSQGHTEAKQYLIDRLSTLSVEPYKGEGFEIGYHASGQDYSNVVAIIEGKDPDLAPVLLGAHYDAVEGTPGADDNAAAVAILLDIAGKLEPHTFRRSVIFAFFDAEEPPNFLSTSMGSIRFFEDQREDDIHCAIIMDLVGHDVPMQGFEDLVFVTGMESNPGLADTIESVLPFDGIRVLPLLNEYVGDLSDHHIFRVNEVPYLFLSCGIWAHYHRDTDTPDKLNYSKAGTIAELVASLAEDISSRSLVSPLDGYDTSEIEARYINETLAAMLPPGGISGRNQIDQLVRTITDQFGIG
jgi:hypothetical protein